MKAKTSGFPGLNLNPEDPAPMHIVNEDTVYIPFPKKKLENIPQDISLGVGYERFIIALSEASFSNPLYGQDNATIENFRNGRDFYTYRDIYVALRVLTTTANNYTTLSEVQQNELKSLFDQLFTLFQVRAVFSDANSHNLFQNWCHHIYNIMFTNNQPKYNPDYSVPSAPPAPQIELPSPQSLVSLYPELSPVTSQHQAPLYPQLTPVTAIPTDTVDIVLPSVPTFCYS